MLILNGRLVNVDIAIQDQTTPVVNWIFHEELETVTLDDVTAIDDMTVDLVAGHSAAAGQLISILEGRRFFQATVLSVSTNELTLDRPLDYAFSVAAAVNMGNADLSVDGSSNSITFHAKAAPLLRWDVVQFVIVMIDNAAMDQTTFAGIPGGLTNGVIMRASDGKTFNIGNVKTNGAFRGQSCDTTIETKVGGGEWCFSALCKFGGTDHAGVVIRLDGAKGDELQIIVQDDLTSVASIMAALIGHVVMED